MDIVKNINGVRKKVFLCVLFLSMHADFFFFRIIPAYAFFQGELKNFCQEDVLSCVFDFNEFGRIALFSKLMDGEKFNFNAKLDHLKFANVDFFANLLTDGEFIVQQEGNSPFIQGKALIRDLLLNNKPSYDLDVYYEVLGASLGSSGYLVKIPYLKWGCCLGYGEIQLGENPTFKLFLDIHQADISELGVLFDLKKLAKACPLFEDCQSGVINAQIQLDGPVKAPRISARFEMEYSDSHAKNHRAVINFRGVYPVVMIDDSFIKDGEDAVFSIRGSVDLNKLAEKGPADSLEYFIRPKDKDSIVIFADASSHSRIRLTNKGVSPFHCGGIAQDPSVSFKGKEEVIQVEHDLRDESKALKMRVASDEEMIGWEHKVRF